jgi:hypothetical protein
MLANDTELVHTVEDVESALIHGLEPLQDGNLQMQVYTISWREKMGV